jgi:1-pyrroline-5-carboxylate dehydrogenase
VSASAEAWEDWARLPWEERAAVFLRAAELLAGPWRSTLVGATMLNQSKTAHQAEIDAACEVIDFFRFNVEFMVRIYEEQPISSPGVWNRLEYRPLEGFVFAISPFNFTAIGANLTSSPALMGDVVLWKPASTAAYSSYWTLKLFEEAGLPPGVVNFIPGSGATVGDAVLASEHLAGVHFTGLDRGLPLDLADRRPEHRQVPQLPAHRRRDRRQGLHRRPPERRRRRGRDRDPARLVRVPGTEVLRGIPRLRALEHLARAEGAAGRGGRDDPDGRRQRLLELHGRGHRRQVVRAAARGDRAREGQRRRGIAGGGVDDSEGYFVEPTVIQTKDPRDRLMQEEFFGPIVTTYVYPRTSGSRRSSSSTRRRRTA